MAQPTYYQFPLPPYSAEQLVWANFYVATYSLRNVDRLRSSVQTRAFQHIKLPLGSKVGFEAQHEFGEGFNPIAPTYQFAPNIANNGGRTNEINIRAREMAPAGFLVEYHYGNQSPLRRFANITELTLVSEARKVYEFKYMLVPKNKQESEAIESICGAFRKTSYPVVAGGLPERTYPQNLWTIRVNGPNEDVNYTGDWLGDPLVCVLKTVSVQKNNESTDPIVRVLPNGQPSYTILGLKFEEFETGTYDPDEDEVLSKSEISYKYFDFTQTTP